MYRLRQGFYRIVYSIHEKELIVCVIIQRRGYEDVAMISAEELSSVLETAHLLRSPQNAILSVYAS